jgi:hypothetical protein
VSYSVNDPRFNWRTTDWTNAAPTLGAANANLNTVGADPKDLGDRSAFMYVRQGPLRGIGELCFLPYAENKPWHTVHLFRNNAFDTNTSARIFDVVSLYPADQARQGLVNPNALPPVYVASAWHALQSVFNGVSCGYPGQVGAFVLTNDEARIVAQAIIARNSASGPCTNISDVCRLLAANFTFLPAGDIWQRKMVMARTIGLLNPRQNLWLIAVTGRAVKDVNNDEDFDATGDTPDFETARAMAVAMVWRDPYEDPTDTANPPGQRRHRSFVQWFGWF